VIGLLRREWPHLLLLAAMFIVSAAAWPLVTEPAPVHWNARMEVDRYGGRFEALLLLPLVALGVYLLLAVLPRLDPARANYASFAGSYALIRFATLLVMAVIHGMIVASALGVAINAGLVIPPAVGLLFILIGAVMGKLRPNYFAGVRTPWTLASAKSWTLTHRLAGRLFVAYGLAMMAMGLVQQPWFILGGMALLFISIAWLVYYSYRVWRDDPDRVPATATEPVEDAG
jgi:uncharacterized membrane protein